MSFEQVSIVLASFIPAILGLYLIYRKDTLRPENPKHLVLAFILGFLAVGLVFAVDWYVMFPTAEYIDSTTPGVIGTIYRTAFEAFVAAGLLEEFAKLLFFGLVIWRLSAFDEFIDGMVLMVGIAMGFAAIENIMYAYAFQMTVTEVLMVRGGLAVPLHAIASGPMGYFVAKAKFEESGRIRKILFGFLIAAIFHGLVDFMMGFPIVEYLLVVYLSFQNSTAAIIDLVAFIVVLLVGAFGFGQCVKRARAKDAGT